MTLAPATFPMRIQIAGVADRNEANLLVTAGVDWLAWPLRLPVNAEDVSETEAADLIRALPPPGRHVLVTYEQTAAATAAFCRKLGVHRVQLHGPFPLAELRRLHELRPDLFVVKSLVVRAGNEAELHELARQAAPWVDAFVTDTYDPATGAEGATGKTHDWAISRRLAEQCSRPLILAGGLYPDTVAAAIRADRPAAVDSHTGGVGADGRKDPALVRRFVAAARAAFAELEGHHAAG
jgi:phosphoribosylanthranilate isomerase